MDSRPRTYAKRLPSGTRRNKRLTVRMTDAMRERLDAYAIANNQTLSQALLSLAASALPSEQPATIARAKQKR